MLIIGNVAADERVGRIERADDRRDVCRADVLARLDVRDRALPEHEGDAGLAGIRRPAGRWEPGSHTGCTSGHANAPPARPSSPTPQRSCARRSPAISADYVAALSFRTAASMVAVFFTRASASMTRRPVSAALTSARASTLVSFSVTSGLSAIGSALVADLVHGNAGVAARLPLRTVRPLGGRGWGRCGRGGI